MATVSKRDGKWWVRWQEPEVINSKPTEGKKWKPDTDAAGRPIWKRWVDRSRTFESHHEAEGFAAERTLAAKRGERFVDERHTAVATIGAVYDWYKDATANDRTKKWRSSMLKTFVDWTGADRPVTDLSGDLLERFANTLPGQGRAASTKHRKVLGVEAMWVAAREPRNRDRFPGVPDVQRVTALSAGDVNAPVQAPSPVVRTAVPTLDDVDAMRAKLRSGYRHGDDHARVALLCRYTGLRISMAVNLSWRDVRLDGGKAGPYIVLRSGARGMKKGKTRVVPLHPALVEEMKTWGNDGGRMFDGDNERWTRGESTREAMRTAWAAAGVDPAKWDVPDDDDEEGARGHGTPTHALRAALFVALLREGVSLDIASYLIGHATTATRAAYVPEASPEASPWWTIMVAAIGKIPAHPGKPPADTGAPRGKVMQLDAERTRRTAG